MHGFVRNKLPARCPSAAQHQSHRHIQQHRPTTRKIPPITAIRQTRHITKAKVVYVEQHCTWVCCATAQASAILEGYLIVQA